MIKKAYFIYGHNKPDTDNYEYYSISELDKIINGSADEIICDCIDAIPFYDRSKLISILISKVKLNSLVIIISNDIYILSKYIMNGLISIEEANRIIATSTSLVDDVTNEAIINNISNIKILDTLYDNFKRTITLQRISK